MGVTGIVLAAGLSSRMGQNKLLMPIQDMPIIGHTLKTAVMSGLDEVYCVYSDALEKYGIQEELGKHSWSKAIKWIKNDKPEEGQSTSLKIALKEVLHHDAIMILLGDQPMLRHDILDYILEKYKNRQKSIIRTKGGKQAGPPVIIPNIFFNELMKIQGDKGARDIIKKYPHLVFDIEVNYRLNIDIDTPEDYLKAIEYFKDGEEFEGFFTRDMPYYR